ncbi:TPA: restriction endonuclease subunit S [Photobacterium damselae]
MSFDYELPDGWSWKTIEEVQESPKGATITGPFGSSIGKKFFVEKGVPVIRGNNLSLGMTPFIDDGFVYVSEEKADELKRYKSIADDLLFTAAGTIGQVGIIPKKSKYDEYIISNKQLRARLDTTVVDPTYAYYWFSSKPMVEYIKRQDTGSTIPLINLGVLRSLPLPVPPLDVQVRIRRILKSFDKKIWINTQTNQTLEQMAQAIFKSWFVDFDPVKAKMNGEQPEGMDAATASLFPEKLVESELGLIPQGWDIKAIKDFGKVVTGKTPPKKVEDAYSEQGVPFVTPSDIDSDVFVSETKRFLSKSGVEVVKKNLLPEGSICVTCIGSQMGKAVISPSLAISNQQINSVVVAKAYERNFLFLNLRRRREEIFLIGSSGSTMPIINKSTFEKLAVLTPSEALIQSFDKAVSALLSKIHQNALENQTLSSLRDTLLPKLLSGEIELAEKAES